MPSTLPITYLSYCLDQPLLNGCSLELWLDPMYDAMDMPARLGQQPIRDYSFGTCAFFVVFVVIGSFLVVNLFVGAVCEKFNKLKKQAEQYVGVHREYINACTNEHRT